MRKEHLVFKKDICHLETCGFTLFSLADSTEEFALKFVGTDLIIPKEKKN